MSRPVNLRQWRIFGEQRDWPVGYGSVWIEDDGDIPKIWRVHCSVCSSSKGRSDFLTRTEAKKAAWKHAKAEHSA